MEKKKILPTQHVLESQQFDTKFLDSVFSLADTFKKNKGKSEEFLKGKIVALLFYQPSTRTRCSFETAAHRLGATTIMTENAEEFSSASKGETLQDTIRIMSGYADFIVMRHKENNSSETAASVSSVPIINAGSGTGQHPSQALLDLFTIKQQFKRLDNLKVAVIGDLARGRTVNSLVYLLSKYSGNSFYFVAPNNSRIKEGIKEHLTEKNISFTETEEMNNALAWADVIYMTRVQKEYFDDKAEYEKTKGKFIINKESLSILGKNAIILHPLPRVDEITTEVDSDPRAMYFEQARNGLFVRMALLKILNDAQGK